MAICFLLNTCVARLVRKCTYHCVTVCCWAREPLYCCEEAWRQLIALKISTEEISRQYTCCLAQSGISSSWTILRKFVTCTMSTKKCDRRGSQQVAIAVSNIAKPLTCIQDLLPPWSDLRMSYARRDTNEQKETSELASNTCIPKVLLFHTLFCFVFRFTYPRTRTLAVKAHFVTDIQLNVPESYLVLSLMVPQDRDDGSERIFCYKCALECTWFLFGTQLDGVRAGQPSCKIRKWFNPKIHPSYVPN